MNDQDKTKEQLVAELAEMRRRVAELEASEAERSRAEVALLGTKREWERTFDSVLDLIAILDNHYRILRVNQAMADRLGLTPEQCVGLTCYEGIHGLSQPPTFCPHALTLADGQDHTTEVHEDRLGGDFLVTTTPLLDERGQMVASVHVARDITERKQAKEVLRESEERYRTLVETAPHAVVMSDLGGRITFASQQALELHGSETVEELCGRDPLDFVAPEDHEKFRENMQRILETGVLRNVEYTLVRKDGTHFAGELSSSLIQDSTGQPQAMMALIQDITERKQAAEELKHSHDQLQAIYDGMVDGLVVVDIDTRRFRRVNSAMCRMVGYTEDELLSMTVMDIHRPEALSRVSEDFETLTQGRPITVESIPVLRKDGSVFYADICTSLVTYNGRPCSTGFFRDITERKRTEEALRQSHEELQAVHEGMFDGLVVADIETKRLIHTNPALRRMLGYSEDELLSLSVMDIHPSDDVPNVLEKFRAQAEGRLIVAESIPVLRKDKSVFYADITTTAIDYLGRRCNIGVFHDITARKKAEEALRREYRVLRQMLKAQDRERQLVAYEIHDGLAQQLTAATMQFQAFEQLQNQDREQASNCYSAGLHMLKESLAEARRLIGGLRPPILDESGIVAAIAHLIHDVMSQGGPEVEFHSSVKSDRLEPLLENAIFRIVQESLTNVRRHSKSDTAEIRLVQDGDHVRIEVQDWGVGFDPDSVGETCFGLAGIRERARVLGGQATIESAPGKGTHITVELPVAVNEGELP